MAPLFPTDLHPRRYIFRGHASGVSAHFRRPENHLLPVQGCSSLPVTGGLSESSLGPQKLEEFISFDAVSTSAFGDYVDAADGVATTLGEVAFDQAPTETRVKADVQGLTILGRVRVGHAAIGLHSQSAVAGEQPAIRLEGNVLEGVSIDGYPLIFTLAENFYCECDTKAKLAARFAAGLAEHEVGLFLPSVSGLEQVTSFPDADGIVKCTIVQEIHWERDPHPTATIHGHVVHVPEFGKIYFGEIYISEESRRLTMVRLQLGSKDGGEVAALEGETNPSTWPPE